MGASRPIGGRRRGGGSKVVGLPRAWRNSGGVVGADMRSLGVAAFDGRGSRRTARRRTARRRPGSGQGQARRRCLCFPHRLINITLGAQQKERLSWGAVCSGWRLLHNQFASMASRAEWKIASRAFEQSRAPYGKEQRHPRTPGVEIVVDCQIRQRRQRAR